VGGCDTCACVSIEEVRESVCVYLHFQHFLKVGSVCVPLHELGVACNELLCLFMWGHYNLHRTTANTWQLD